MIVVGIACWCSYVNNVDTGLDILSLSIGMCKCKRMPLSILATSRDNMFEIRSFNCSVDADTVCCALCTAAVADLHPSTAAASLLMIALARPAGLSPFFMHECAERLSLSFSLDPKRPVDLKRLHRDCSTNTGVWVGACVSADLFFVHTFYFVFAISR